MLSNFPGAVFRQNQPGFLSGMQSSSAKFGQLTLAAIVLPPGRQCAIG